MQLDLWQQPPPPARPRDARTTARNGTLRTQAEPSLTAAHTEAERLVQSAHRTRTRRAYQTDWKAFEDWCAQHGLAAMPASVETLCGYLAALKLRGYRYSTIRRKRLAIGLAHGYAGLPRPERDPRVRALELCIAKEVGVREVGADPLLAEDIPRLVATLDDSARGNRARALFTLAFAGGFRSSELVALDHAHLTFTENGVRVHIARSKEDPLGRGRDTNIPRGYNPATCPVRALERWLAHVGEGRGPVFRELRGNTITAERMSTRAVSRAVQRATSAIGLTSTQAGFSSHSFRKGLITEAEARGFSPAEIANHCRYAREQSIARYLVRDRVAARRNIADGML